MGKKPASISAHVKQFGWHIAEVLGNEHYPPFASTIGLTFTLEHPELVLFGLNDDLDFMAEVLGDLALRVASGERFEHGAKKRGVLQEVTCQFARFPRSAFVEHLGQAIAYYGGADRFDAVQCLWPDLKKRLPWDRRVMPEALGQQPVFLRPDAGPRDPVWPFEDAHSRRVLTTRPIVAGKEPVRLVGRDLGGDWQFLCNTTEDDSALVVATLGWLYDHDPTLKRAAKVAPGTAIGRSELGGRWKKERTPSNEG